MPQPPNTNNPVERICSALESLVKEQARTADLCERIAKALEIPQDEKPVEEPEEELLRGQILETQKQPPKPSDASERQYGHMVNGVFVPLAESGSAEYAPEPEVVPPVARKPKCGDCAHCVAKYEGMLKDIVPACALKMGFLANITGGDRVNPNAPACAQYTPTPKAASVLVRLGRLFQ